MTPLARCSILVTTVTLWLGTGCQQTTFSLTNYTQVRFEDRAWTDVYQAARQTMNEYFRIDQAVTEQGLIRSVPTLDVGNTSERPLGFSLSSPPTIRKIAEFRIIDEGRAVIAACNIIEQRQDTAQEQTFYRQHGSDDRPSQTPLEENQGLAETSQATWTTTGYDRRLEKEMLAALAERLSQ